MKSEQSSIAESALNVEATTAEDSDGVVELAIEDLVEIPTEEPLAPMPRSRRWTPLQGVTSQPEIRVGVMLGTRRGSS